MSRLRVLHVIGGGDTGGAMTHLLPLLSALGAVGCEVYLLCLGEGGLAEQGTRRGLSVAVLPMDRAWDVSVMRPLRGVVAGGPADLGVLGSVGARRTSRQGAAADALPLRWHVVHTHGMRANLPVRLLLAGSWRRPCLFTTVHSDLRLDYASVRLARLYQGVDRATLSGVDTVICVSDSLRRLLLERGYPAERLLTIRSGMELRPEKTGVGRPGPVEPGPDTAGLSPRSAARPRVATFARLVPVKDLDLLLEVADLLRRITPSVEVMVVGEGPERERLETRSRALGLGEVVRFTGRLDDVGTVLAGTDAYLVTSVFEGGVSMSVLEAMAAAVPVVTTAAGGVAEAVKDGETGFVVRRGQERDVVAAALAERVAALLADHDLRARMGAAGARRARNLFSIERTAAATVRAYERCVAARGGLL